MFVVKILESVGPFLEFTGLWCLMSNRCSVPECVDRQCKCI